MAESVIEICNNALGSIGESAITSLTDNTKAARACNRRWVSVRDSVLRSHEWACCSTDFSLVLSSTAPISPEWDYAYPLPSDFLRVIRVTNDGAEVVDMWEIVGAELLCNEETPLVLRYVRRETNPVRYDPLLSDALAARLAWELCPMLKIVSASLVAQLRETYKEKLSEARGVNARDVQPRRLLESRWSIAKRG